MASVITVEFGSGGGQMTPQGGAGEPTLVNVLRDSIDDMTDVRTKFDALMVRLDAEGGLGGGYVVAGALNTQLLTKG